jgi:hypothetical protein
VGQLVFLTTTNLLYVWNGTSWVLTGGSVYLPLSGGTLTGPLIAFRNPQTTLEVATKAYVDAGVSTVDIGPLTARVVALESTVTGLPAQYLSLNGGTLAGPLILNANPTAALGAVPKQLVDSFVFVGTTIPPAGVNLWFRSDVGRLFVNYGGVWVDASPATSVDASQFLSTTGGVVQGPVQVTRLSVLNDDPNLAVLTLKGVGGQLKALIFGELGSSGTTPMFDIRSSIGSGFPGRLMYGIPGELTLRGINARDDNGGFRLALIGNTANRENRIIFGYGDADPTGAQTTQAKISYDGASEQVVIDVKKIDGTDWISGGRSLAMDAGGVARWTGTLRSNTSENGVDGVNVTRPTSVTSGRAYSYDVGGVEKFSVNYRGDVFGRSWNVISDPRFKRDMELLDPRPSTLQGIQAWAYSLLADHRDEPKQLGFLTSQVKLYLPELIDDSGTQEQLNITGMLPVLWALVQRLERRIEVLETALAAKGEPEDGA